MLTVYNRIKHQVDLQVDKSPVVVVGDSHNGPLIIGKNPFFRKNNKNTNELMNCKLHPTQSRPGDRSPRPWRPHWPIKRSAPAPLRRNSASLEGPGAVPPKLRLARGLDAPSGETPPLSRARCPLGRNSYLAPARDDAVTSDQ
jgi:hypothetical protein